MPAPITLEEARRVIVEQLTGRGRAASDARVGIEAEVFAMSVDAAGAAGARVDLAGPGGALAIARATHLGRETERAGNPSFDLGELGHLTFEPGAQIEHATQPQVSISAAIDDIHHVRSALASSAAEFEQRLVACGSDLWHYADDIPQFLPGPRYKAMADYFHMRGHAGPEMMRNTASVQINLDAGNHLTERWLAANLLAPLLTATFSTSTTAHAAARRALTWQRLDPSRTGFPSLVEDPLDAISEWALAADVMLVWDGPRARPLRPGTSLRAWIEGDGPLRAATEEDVRYHLTTLFPEVRLRHDVLEIRGVDSLPATWIGAPVVLVTGAIYDPIARSGILELLEPHRRGIRALWSRAAVHGLADPDLARLAAEVWLKAYDGAQRLRPPVRPSHLATAVGFLESYTLRGLAPTAGVSGPLDHLGRCLEPVPPGSPAVLVGSAQQKGSP